jgi:hypothetical protein
MGQTIEAEVTDHIIALSFGGSPYDQRNLMSLCKYQHDRKSGYESSGLFLSTKRTEHGLIPVDRQELISMMIFNYNDTTLKSPHRPYGGEGSI